MFCFPCKKNVDFDSTTEKKLRELFKKFVKKWNGGKLAMVSWDPSRLVFSVLLLGVGTHNRKLCSQKYYVGVDPLWAVSSPGAYSRTFTSTPENAKNVSDSQDTTSLCDSSMFGTFGKSTGQKVAAVSVHVFVVPLDTGSTPTDCMKSFPLSSVHLKLLAAADDESRRHKQRCVHAHTIRDEARCEHAEATARGRFSFASKHGTTRSCSIFTICELFICICKKLRFFVVVRGRKH